MTFQASSVFSTLKAKKVAEMLMLLMTAYGQYDVTFCEYMNVKSPEVFLSGA